jgi:hypothetical protein
VLTIVPVTVLTITFSTCLGVNTYEYPPIA